MTKDERHQIIRAMWSTDATMSQMLNATGYKYRKSVWLAAQSMGLGKRESSKREGSRLLAKEVFRLAKPGVKRAEIAEKVGVSITSVSRILHNPDNIARFATEETAARMPKKRQAKAPPPPRTRVSCAPSAQRNFFDTYGDGLGAVARYQATREARA